MKRYSLCSILSVSVGALATLSSVAIEPNELATVLKLESAGQAVDRRVQGGSQISDEAVAWHAGMVKVSDQWKTIDQLGSTEAIAEYRKKRAELDNDPQKHWSLAHWCVLHQLPELARAHYFGVLASDFNNLEARGYLGHVLVGDTWFEQADLIAAQQNFQQQFDQLNGWVPKLKPIVAGIQSSNATVTAEALRKLDGLDPETTLPALEFYASNIDDDLAKPLIRKIAKVRSREACLALVRIALAHPSSSICELTTQVIRQYPESFYIPELLSMLSGESTVTNNLVVQPNGNLGLVSIVKNEMQNKSHVQKMRKLVNVISIFSSNHSIGLSNSTVGDVSIWSNYWNIPKSDPQSVGAMGSTQKLSLGKASASAVYVPADVAVSTVENLAAHGKMQEREVARQNRERRERVNSVCTLLRATTQQDIQDQPRLWWEWWNDRNERYAGPKPTSFAYREQRQKIEVSTQVYAHESGSNVNNIGSTLIQYSCLVPGTLVQTGSGLVPIEQIQIGDLVLSQDVETAELSLKPVIMTTVRPPKSTLKILSSGTAIEATGGHSWWVSGQGWLKTRDLKPGMMLHTATGTLEVQALEENPTEQKTYNLVVDGFHTYFVGPERALSYDNTQVKPTLRQLPGYGLLAETTK